MRKAASLVLAGLLVFSMSASKAESAEPYVVSTAKNLVFVNQKPIKMSLVSGRLLLVAIRSYLVENVHYSLFSYTSTVRSVLST
jgi:hypothetical protein